jgi:hypothetical protein
MKRTEYTLWGVLIGVIFIAAACITAYAEEPVMTIYTDAYMEAMNAREMEVGIAPGEDLPQGEVVDNAYMTIPISDEEARELRWVLALEAQGEGLRGEMAVCEAIFNRVLSPRWPDTVHGVLAQRGQFSTYKRIGSSRAWAVPGEAEDDAISEVLRTGPSILPDMKYVYFDSVGGVNGRRKVKLGKHTFGAER